MIADVVFDIPLARSFTYRVPAELSVAPGQRVRAPLHGKARVGVVVACREAAEAGLKALDGPVERGALLDPVRLELARWIASESFSSLGSTCAALLPPVAPRTQSPDLVGPPFVAEGRGDGRDGRGLPQLLSGGGRDGRLLSLLAGRAEHGGVLLLVPEVEAARAWAERLAAHFGQPVLRLDSGRPDRERWRAWMELARGSARIAVGTRSALLAPVPEPATLVLVDEHDPGHKPPGHPRMHSREVVLERARREGQSVVLTSATPSVESWWQADSGRLIRTDGSPAPWPEVSVVDARGGLRSSPLSAELRRAMKETLGSGGQVFLLVTRVSSVLACGECGFLLRCRDCELALAYSRSRRECSCRLCGRRAPAPDTCPHCLGRQLFPFGWGAERVEQAVRLAFPRLGLARYDGELLTPAGARQLGRQWDDRAVRLVIGTRHALKALDPAGCRLVGVITPDHVLRLPDFRAGERAFALLWAAAEWLGDRGRLLIQTQHPDHHAIGAVAAQELGGFYKPELKFRAEVSYPPFRRLCLVTVRGREASQARRLAEECQRELARLPGLAVYAPTPYGRPAQRLAWRIVVKGGGDLPHQLGPALAPFLEARRGSPGVVEVEMDPLELV